MHRPPLIAASSWLAIIAGFVLVGLYAIAAGEPSASLINAIAGFFLVLGGVVVRIGGSAGRWGGFLLATVLLYYAVLAGVAAWDASGHFRWVFAAGALALAVFAVLFGRVLRSDQARLFFA